jgi:hypothetical protein
MELRSNWYFNTFTNQKMNNMKRQVFAFMAIFSLVGLFDVNAQGLIISDDYKKEFNAFEPADKGFAADIPPKASLRKYAPTPRNQQGSTCVGWASAYAAMSTQYNYTYGITNTVEKDAFAFDPYFLFHQIKGEDNADCATGTSLLNALVAMRDYGVKRQLFPAHMVCENNMSTELYNRSLGFAKPFRIKDALVFDLANAETVDVMKYAISIGMPVLIGTNITEQMEVDSRAKYGAGKGLWEPKDEYKDKLGGHAMCIVGYDDSKFGGAWEIQNSWGTSVGDNGYIWIKYSDFNKIAVAATVIELYDLNTSKPACQLGDCDNEYSRADFGNGELYEGEVKNGTYNGWGYLKLKDGSVYSGPFVEGDMQGKGIYLTADYKWYIVQMDKGKLIDSQALGFSVKPTAEDAITTNTANFISNYVEFQDGMPDATILDSSNRKKAQ